MYEFQLSQLIKFEENFAEYIRSQDSLSNMETFGKIENLYFDIIETVKNNKSTSITDTIISFNYTESIKNALYKGNENWWKSIIPIHGRATEKVIFGIDEHLSRGKELPEIKPDSPLYSFTKTARIMNSPQVTRSNGPITLKPGVKNIRFYGHSLSKFDYSYLQSIFDFYKIYDTKVVLKFFYSIYCKDKEEEIRKTQMNSVIQLLKIYGETMDNQDHGKNLLHKLMLEGRLKIIKLPKDPSDLDTKPMGVVTVKNLN